MYEEYAEFLKDKLRKKEFEWLMIILNTNDIFGKFIIRLILQKHTIRRCGAGVNKISICANGDIYPCDSFVGKKEFLMGNIYTNYSPCTINENTTIYHSSKCKRCWIRFLCGGDCYHNSYLLTHDVYNTMDYFCVLNRTLVELAIDVFNTIMELDNSEILFIKKMAALHYEQ